MIRAGRLSPAAAAAASPSSSCSCPPSSSFPSFPYPQSSNVYSKPVGHLVGVFCGIFFSAFYFFRFSFFFVFDFAINIILCCGSVRQSVKLFLPPLGSHDIQTPSLSPSLLSLLSTCSRRCAATLNSLQLLRCADSKQFLCVHRTRRRRRCRRCGIFIIIIIKIIKQHQQQQQQQQTAGGATALVAL